jgi:DNA repair ATPase RecN
MQAYAENQGGSSKTFLANALDDATQRSILDGFHKEREQEYFELQEQCDDLLAELEKETQRRNFSFAEYEENEQDLEKLENWFKRIQQRDFSDGEMANQSAQRLEECRQALQTFANAVFDNEGLGTNVLPSTPESDHPELPPK